MPNKTIGKLLVEELLRNGPIVLIQKIRYQIIHARKCKEMTGKILTAFGNIQYYQNPMTKVFRSSFQGNILVPFAVESALSGVGKTVGKDSILWYDRTITIHGKRKGKKILLHFGAVDWRSDIYVNGNKVGTHEGGYDPFTVDITAAIKIAQNNN